MWQYVVYGVGLAFTAAIQPGPSQAYMLSRVAAIGWRKTLPAALSPLLSDGPIAVIALLVLGQLSPMLQSALRLAGGGLLCCFSWRSWKQWRLGETELEISSSRAPKTIFEAALVNMLNPNPYIGWALILGPVVISAWREAPSSGVALLIAFYGTMVTTLALMIYALGTTQWLSARIRRGLLLVSAVILAGFGLYQAAMAMRVLFG